MESPDDDASREDEQISPPDSGVTIIEVDESALVSTPDSTSSPSRKLNYIRHILRHGAKRSETVVDTNEAALPNSDENGLQSFTKWEDWNNSWKNWDQFKNWDQWDDWDKGYGG